MKRIGLLLCTLLAACTAAAQAPVYLVNGEVRSDLSGIDPEDIVATEELPADEESIARYGQQASHGVILVTLRYDTPARFPGEVPFDEYVAKRIVWDDPLPVARVVVRYTVSPMGEVIPGEVLEATDRRLLRRVRKALVGLPRWEPARYSGEPLVSEGVLTVQLPAGREMPREMEWVMR